MLYGGNIIIISYNPVCNLIFSQILFTFLKLFYQPIKKNHAIWTHLTASEQNNINESSCISRQKENKSVTTREGKKNPLAYSRAPSSFQRVAKKGDLETYFLKTVLPCTEPASLLQSVWRIHKGDSHRGSPSRRGYKPRTCSEQAPREGRHVTADSGRCCSRCDVHGLQGLMWKRTAPHEGIISFRRQDIFGSFCVAITHYDFFKNMYCSAGFFLFFLLFFLLESSK